MKKHTIIKKKSSLDKFYTKPEIARSLIDTALMFINPENVVFIEPAAGNGSFVKPLIKKKIEVVAYDIQPDNKIIKKADFLTLEFSKIEGQRVAVIGNPPFGRVSSLAIRFFNKAAEFSDFICFIVPKTFRKESVIRKLDSNFWLIHDQDLPKNSFLLDNKPHDVPCCFQIWEKRELPRDKTADEDILTIIEYTKDPSEADLAIRRVGANAGKIIEKDITSLSVQSHYFINLVGISKSLFMKKYKNIDFSIVVNNTAGIRSLSKRELAKLLNEHVGK